MKQPITATLFSAALLGAAAHLPAQAQTKPAPQPRYAQQVSDNPTAEADIQTVGTYMNLLVAGNTDKASQLVADTYRGYGPGVADSVNRDQTIAGWQQNYKTQLNRKLRLEGQTTFRVKTGPLQGNWVASWGQYSFTQNGKTIRLPIQYTAHLTKGKIDLDRIYYDNLSVVRALGYKVTPPEAAK